jgi:glycosyltransferase involved in cell wall biosynthesis
MASLSVATLSHIFPSRPGSADPGFVWEQVSALGARHRMCVVAPVPWCPPVATPRRRLELRRLPAREEWSGTPVSRPRYPLLPRRALFGLLPLAYALTAGRCLARAGGQSHLIHAHFAYPDGVAAAWVARRLGKPLVLTLHGSDLNEYPAHWLWRPQIAWALRRASALIVASRSLARRAVELGASEERVFIIPPAVNTEIFAPRDKRASRRALGLPADLPTVLFVGRLDPVKTLPDLLRAFALLSATQEAHLVLVGEGPERNRLRSLAQRLGIAGRVQFAGRKPREEVACWMSAADLLALSSSSEGFGLVLAESIACGRPVVATRCGGPEDIVTPEVGRLVPCGCPEALSDAMAQVLASLDSFPPPQLAARARELWAPASIVSRITQVYHRCLAEGNG